MRNTARVEQVAAVIVTFNPTDLGQLFGRVKILSEEIGLVILSDNSDIAAVFQKIRSFAEGAPKILYLGNGVNGGIGRAQNIAFDCEAAKEFDFFVTFDQDSKIYKGLVSSLCDSFNSLSDDRLKLACVGPFLVNERTGKVYERFVTGKVLNAQVNTADYIASSGMLIPRQVLSVVGGMKAEWFIDLLDVEWCYRARSMGYEIGVSRVTEMRHLFGARDLRLPWGKKIVIPAPVRMYYIYRNVILFARLSYIPVRVRILMVVSHLLKLPIYCFSGQTVKRVSLSLRGITSGFFSKT